MCAVQRCPALNEEDECQPQRQKSDYMYLRIEATQPMSVSLCIDSRHLQEQS